MKRRGKFEDLLERSFDCSLPVPKQQIDFAWEQILRRAVHAVPAKSDAIYAAARLPFRWKWPVFVAVAIVFSVLAAIGVARFSRAAAVLETANGARTIRYGEPVRSDDQPGTIIVLADGSRVEMRAHTDLSRNE